MKKWIKKGSETLLKDVFLRNIGASSLDEVNGWFKKSYANEYHIDRLDEAAALCMKFKDKHVTIIGDYDVDGTTATSTLLLGLRSLGFKDISYRIPKRFSEGFGINDTIIDEIESGLIITCDNGIAQPDAIKKAKNKGLTVIILDHHEPLVVDGKIVYPEADIIIDPNAIEGSADFNGYCGCGLCYKFIKALGVSKQVLDKALSMAALGTVADVMELREENYVFVKNGFKALLNPNTTTSGIYALVCAFELSKHITAKDIGFKLGPALNACSRMNDEGAKDAVELLSYEGPFPMAVKMAESVITLNNERKELKKTGMEEAHRVIEENCLYGECPIVLKVDVPEGIIGIIAGNICEEYHTPAIVVCKTEEGVLKGSARSCGNYNMKEALDKVSHLLIRHGGHAGAAGLSLAPENFDVFCTEIQSTANGFVCDEANDDVICYDLEIKAQDIPEVIKELDRYEPFGNGNAMPIFKVDNYSVNPKNGNYINKVTSDYDITKLFYKKDVVAIGFDMSARFKNVVPKNISLIGTLSLNYFNGSMTNQCEFIDFMTGETKTVTTPLAEKLKRMALSTTA